MSRQSLSGFLTLDIEYLIESDRRTASDNLYITQLLPTRYSINITKAFSGYQYNKQWMYIYEMDFRLNIHLMYVGIRRITDWIFIWCMNGSGGWLTKYSFGVCRDPADYRLNIHLVYKWVRRISNWIFSWCMQGSNGLLTGYSFDVWTGQVDCWPNIHLVYAGIQWITNQIFILCMQGSGGLPIGYSLIGLGGLKLNI